MTGAGAVFSRCRRWRYLLWRCWDEAKPVANFLMLNPSTADELKLDPSCTRARLYAERWGFGALVVTNLFGWRATDPDEMKAVRDPVGAENDRAILGAARTSGIVVCAWGEPRRAPRALGRGSHPAPENRYRSAHAAHERQRRAGASALSAGFVATAMLRRMRNRALTPIYSSGIPESRASCRQSARSTRLISRSLSGVEVSAV
jgi:hypothetical protein